MATPTFLLTPSGYKAGTLYAPLPADGDGDMEMTRSAIATRVNQNGIIQDSAVDVPRIDYLYGGCPSCIFEEATTNIIDESEDFSTWNVGSADVNTSPVVSPDGNTNAYRIQGDGTSGNFFVRYLFTLPSAGRYTYSVFVRAANGTSIWTVINGLDDNLSLGYNVSTGVLNDTDPDLDAAGVEDYGNGWYRVWGSGTTTTDLSGAFFIFGSPDGTTNVFPSNAAAAAASIDIFGAQLEMQDRPHSYVKTTGSVVSSAADLYRLTNIGQFFGTNTGAFYVEFADYPFRYESSNVNFLTMYDQSTSDYIRFRGDLDTFLGPQAVGWSSSSPTYSTEPVVSSIRKLAFTWDGSDWKSKVNGQSEQTGAVTANFNPTILGQSGGGYNTADSLVRLKTLAFYDRKLTSNELDELTTL